MTTLGGIVLSLCFHQKIILGIRASPGRSPVRLLRLPPQAVSRDAATAAATAAAAAAALPEAAIRRILPRREGRGFRRRRRRDGDADEVKGANGNIFREKKMESMVFIPLLVIL